MNNTIRDIIQRNSEALQPRPTGHRPLLARLSGIRAVLFDIYGTLFISGSGDIGANQAHAAVDPTDRQRRIVRETFQATGIADPPENTDVYLLLQSTISEVHTQMRSAGIDYPEVDIVDVWRSVFARVREQEQWPCPPITDGLLRQLAVEYEVRTNPVWPMPGAADCLRALRDAGLVLGVVSNAQFYTPELFPALLGEEMHAWGFDPRLCWFSFEQRRAKPGTELYLMARGQLENCGIAADEVVFVGNDMLNDVAAARQTGFHTALFAGDRRSLRLREEDPRIADVVPDLVIDHLDQLLDCVVG